jgi:hypothetical protein
MPKGKTPDRGRLLGTTEGKRKFSSPPPLSDIPAVGSQQRKQNETRTRRQKVETRWHKVKEALQLLPLTEKKTDVSRFISAFEQTYYTVVRETDDKFSTASLLEKQLNDMVRKCDKLESHVNDMHRDALSAWAKAGSVHYSMHVGIDSAALVLILNAASERAEIALAAIKAGKRAAKKGSSPDAMAAAMRDAAGEFFRKLTNKRDGRAYNSHTDKEEDTEFIKFLRHIYDAYGIRASARSRARVRPTL